jgi:hypothetical protein
MPRSVAIQYAAGLYELANEFCPPHTVMALKLWSSGTSSITIIV